MPRKKKELPRGPMIHVRLDEKTHRELKVYAVSSGGTIQSVVAELIRKKLTADKGKSQRADRRDGGK